MSLDTKQWVEPVANEASELLGQLFGNCPLADSFWQFETVQNADISTVKCF